MEATQRLMLGRTTFMIAHRLNTLKSCDLVLVLDEGRLQEINECRPEARLSAAGL
jgi:ATP-binding cassette subfamily B protein